MYVGGGKSDVIVERTDMSLLYVLSPLTKGATHMLGS